MIERDPNFQVEFDSVYAIYIGWCPSLNLYAHGRTHDQALLWLQDTVSSRLDHELRRRVRPVILA